MKINRGKFGKSKVISYLCRKIIIEKYGNTRIENWKFCV